MSSWYNVITKIETLVKHPNADTLDLITVLGDFPVVAKSGQYKVGDLCCYISVDTIAPDNEDFYFLCPLNKEKYEEDGEVKERTTGPKYPVGSVPEKYRRIRSKKIRDIYSQGMLFPIQDNLKDLKEGDDVTEILGLKKYEEEEEENIPGSKVKSGDQEKAPEGWKIPYYDIEGIRKYIKCLQDNEEIVLTEKVHGCFKSDTPINMFDGTKKDISLIERGDVVLGIDSNNNIVPNKVLNVFDNGKSNDWVKVKISRNRMGRGTSYQTITCTSNHEFFSNGKYIPISNLNVDDDVSFYREDIGVPELAKQILIGKILGDGSIEKRNGGWAIRFGHSIKDIDYFNWTVKGLGETFLTSSINEITSGYGSKIIRGTTCWSFAIRNEFSKFIDPLTGKKIITKDIVNDLTPIALAFWYMDDGSLGYSDEKNQECTANLATCSFSNDECLSLCEALSKFGIEASVTNFDYNRILINAKNAERFFLIVAPFIPPSMQRKLPKRYRGGNGWLPEENLPQKFSLISKQKIMSIEKLDKNFSKFDIETETHNYFANNILVHNSNYSVVYDGEKVWCKSRNRYLKRDEDCDWWEVTMRLGLEEKLKAYPNLVFFGELTGKVKGFRYGCPIVNGKLETTVYFFDIYNTKTNRYLSYDEFVSIIDELKLNKAPLLYRGPWIGKEKMYPYAEGITTLNDKHIREGFVLRTAIERFEPKLNSRMIVKLIGEGYSLNKK